MSKPQTIKDVLDNLASDLSLNARSDDPPHGRVWLKNVALQAIETILKEQVIQPFTVYDNVDYVIDEQEKALTKALRGEE